jgi:hypothetical protein
LQLNGRIRADIEAEAMELPQVHTPRRLPIRPTIAARHCRA